MVSDLEERRGVFYPVFSFKDNNGKEHSFRSHFGRNPPAYQRGDSVEILYDPDATQKARIDSFAALWFWSIFCAAMGVGDLIVGGGCVFAGRMISRHIRRGKCEPGSKGEDD